jgi:uncharacterized protein (DUF305 family)
MNYARLWLPALLVAIALAAAGCGGTGGGQQGDGGTGGDMQGMDGMDDGEMSGMDTTMEETTGMTDEVTGMDGMESTGGMSGMEGMDHGSMDMGSMLMENGEYSDERFIDSMVPHHIGAVEMAEVALDGNAERDEIVQLSQNIVRTQNAEIEELRQIKQQEFGTSEVPTEMSSSEMEMMGMMMDPAQLAEQDPFDLAFINNMIPHHQSAIEMAEVALENTDNPRIRNLAQEIIAAQEQEIAQMEQWREEWYPESQ